MTFLSYNRIFSLPTLFFFLFSNRIFFLSMFFYFLFSNRLFTRRSSFSYFRIGYFLYPFPFFLFSKKIFSGSAQDVMSDPHLFVDMLISKNLAPNFDDLLERKLNLPCNTGEVEGVLSVGKRCDGSIIFDCPCVKGYHLKSDQHTDCIASRKM
jgi:hypothetical protein